MKKKIIIAVIILIIFIFGIIIFMYMSKSNTISALIKANNNITTTTVYYNDEVKLNWDSENADYCEISGDLQETVPSAGSKLIEAVQEEKTYTLKCFNKKNEVALSSIVVRLGEKPLAKTNEEIIPEKITTEIPVLNTEPSVVVINNSEEPATVALKNSSEIQITPPAKTAPEAPAKITILPPTKTFIQTITPLITRILTPFYPDPTPTVIPTTPTTYTSTTTVTPTPTITLTPITTDDSTNTPSAPQQEAFGGIVYHTASCGRQTRNSAIFISGEHGGRFIWVNDESKLIKPLTSVLFNSMISGGAASGSFTMPSLGMNVLGELRNGNQKVPCDGAGGSGKMIDFAGYSFSVGSQRDGYNGNSN